MKGDGQVHSKSAVISDCGKYRYALSRVWYIAQPIVSFVMLNPSTADADVDDNTIRSCIRLARAWNYGGIFVVNLFAWRSTDPDVLMRVKDPIGPRNDVHIYNAIAHSNFTICAWGAHKAALSRAADVVDMIRLRKTFAHCLGATKSGAPKHPLYIKTGTMPEVYRLSHDRKPT